MAVIDRRRHAFAAVHQNAALALACASGRFFSHSPSLGNFAAAAMNSAQVHDTGGPLRAVAIDAIVGCEKITVQNGNRISCRCIDQNLKMIRLANEAHVGLM